MLLLDDFGNPMRASITLLAVSGLRQSQSKYKQLVEAVEQHEPDVVVVCGDFLEHSRLEVRDRISVESCSSILGGLKCHELILVHGLRDTSLLNQFKGAWQDDGLELCLLNRRAKALKRAVAVGFPPRLKSDDSCQKRFHEFRQWFSPILETHVAAARTLWLLPEPPALDMHQFPQSRREWRKAIDKFLPRIVLFGCGLNVPIRDERMLWLTKREMLLVSLGQPIEAPLSYCMMELMFMGDVPCLPSEVTATAYPTEESITINGECWRI